MNTEAQTPPARIPLKGLRGSIARNMSAGWQAPRVGMAVEVDMSRCQALRPTLQAAAGAEKITLTPILLRALALTLHAHPRLNALIRDDGIEPVANVHLGVAVSLAEGLAVPVLRDAETKSVAALAAELRELAAGARAGKLPPRAYQSGTFTVSNLGMTGIDWFTPILNAPQVGILGISRIADRAIVRDGALVVAPMTTLTLVFDHRAIDGEPAARFLADLRRRIEAGDDL